MIYGSSLGASPIPSRLEEPARTSPRQTRAFVRCALRGGTNSENAQAHPSTNYRAKGPCRTAGFRREERNPRMRTTGSYPNRNSCQEEKRQQYTYLTNGNFSANLECGNHLLWRFFRGFSVQRNAAVPAKIIPAAKLTRFPLGKRNAHCAAYMKMKNRAIGTAKLCSFNFGSPSFR